MARHMQGTSFARRFLPLLCFALFPLVAMHCASADISDETQKVVKDEPKQKEVSPRDMDRAQREVALALRMVGDELNRKYVRGAATQQGDDPVTPVHRQIGRELGEAGSKLEYKAKLRKAEGSPVVVKEVAKEIEQVMSWLYSSVMGELFLSVMNGGFLPRSPMKDAARHVRRVTFRFFGRGDDKGENAPCNGDDGVDDDAGTAATEKVAVAAASAPLAEDGTKGDVGDDAVTAAIEEVAEAVVAGALAKDADAVVEGEKNGDGTKDDVGDDAVTAAIEEVAEAAVAGALAKDADAVVEGEKNWTNGDGGDDAGIVVAEGAAAPTEDGTADEKQADPVVSEKELEDAVADLYVPNGMDGFKEGIEKKKHNWSAGGRR